MAANYRVRLEKEYHVFSAAHFITFAANICERLHGHNYRVFAEVPDDLDENQYVVDFIALRDELKAITDELDHRMLLPTGHPLIDVRVVAAEVHVRFTLDQRRWVFPLEDCCILPISNTTAELLADFIGRKLLDRLQERTGIRPPALTIGVDENHGQWGICELLGE